jgi:hypothetical protein
MEDQRRIDSAIVGIFGVAASLAIVSNIFAIGPSLRLFATIAGILLGPGALIYRIVTRSGWVECVAVGVAINVASLMVLGLFSVTAHFWHPIRLELLIPLITVLLAIVLLERIRRASLADISGVGRASDD